MKRKIAITGSLLAILLILFWFVYLIVKFFIWLNGIPVTDSNSEIALAIIALLLAVIGMFSTL